MELRDFSAAPVRGWLEARLLAAAGDANPPPIAEAVRGVLGAMRGTVVEIGPGPGTNLRHYAPGVRVIAVEPNPAMVPLLRREAAARAVDVEVVALHAERASDSPLLPDDVADHVVGTLVLCGVDHPRVVVAEVLRMLRPGGTFLFHEHVAGRPGSGLRLLQRAVAAPHRWLFNGCELGRDTGALLRRSGFADIAIEEVDAGPSAAWTRRRILGVATA